MNILKSKIQNLRSQFQNRVQSFSFLKSKIQNLKSNISRRNIYIFGISILAVGLLISVLTSKSVEAGWWDETWLYRIKETFTNSASAIANYQVSITLDTATLITASKMQTDCDDVRLTDIGGKELPYWIEESGVGGCNSATTKIWTKLPMLYAGKTDIYLYYGNSQTASGANGNEVFEQFDTFSGTTLDGTKWIGSGHPELVSGSLKLEGGDTVVSNTTKTDANGLGQIIYRAKQAITNLTVGKIGFSNTNNLSTHYQTDDAAVGQIGSTEETVSAIASTNLVSHYQLEETTSTDANQFKASGYFDTGKLNQAVSMYGNSAGTLGSTLTFNRGTQISGYNYEHINANQGTISFWFKPSWSGNPTVTKTLYRNTYGTPGNIYVGITGTLTYYYWNGSTQYTASIAGTSWSSSAWYHVVARWNIDAAVSGSQRIAVTLNTADSSNGYTSDFTTQAPGPVNVIGSLEDGSQTSNALIDDFAIYDRVLTTTEISSLYNSGTGNEAGYVADPSLKFYAKLDGSGTLQPVTYNAGVNVDQKAYNVSTNTNGNMVTDWDMETAGTANWTADGTYVASGAILTKITAGVFADTQSLQIDINNTNQGVRALISASTNSNYSLSFWCKGGQTIFPRIRSLPDNVAIISTNTDCSASWGKKDYVFKTTASTTQLAVEFADSGTLTFYLDNVTLTPSLIDNGGMEGTYTGSGTLFFPPTSGVQFWISNFLVDGVDTAAAETTIVHSGPESQKIIATAQARGVTQGISLSGLTLNNWYMVSSWVYLVSGRVHMLGQNRWTFNTPDLTTTGAWIKLSSVVQYTGTSGGWPTVVIRSSDGYAATFYVDDVSVIPLDNVATSFKPWTPVNDTPGENSTERALNPGFEVHTGTADDGVTDTFTSWLQETGTNGIIDATTSMHDGSKAVKMYNSSTSLRPVIYQNLSGLTIGQTYKFSVWNKQTSGATAYLRLIENAGAGANLVVATLSGNTEYSQYSTFFTPTTSNPQIALYHNSTTTGTVYWDDVSLKEVPNPLSVQGNPASGVVSTTSGARGNAYTFDGSTGTLRQKTYDVNVGTLSYLGDDTTNAEFRDTGQNFDDWDVASGDGLYLIHVVNSDGTLSWGFLGTNNNGGLDIDVYTTRSRATRGWNTTDGGTLPIATTKTPVGYEIRKAEFDVIGDTTMLFWIKTNATAASNRIIDKYAVSAGYLLSMSNTGIVTATSVGNSANTSTTSINDNVWHQVAWVYQSGVNQYLYIDGKLEDTDAITALDLSTLYPFFLMSNDGGTNFVSGSLDQFAFIKQALTADQIKDIYNSTASHYGLTTNNATVNNAPANSSSPVVDANVYHSWTLSQLTSSATLSSDGVLVSTSTTNLPNSAMYIRAQNSSSSSIYIDWIAATKQLATQPSAAAATEEKSPAPVGYWKLDEGTGSDVKDSSGSGLTGTITGATWQTEDLCVSGKCLNFNGSSNYVNLAQNSNYAYQNGDTWTIGAWFKTTASITGTNGGKVIVSKGTGNAIPGYALVIGQLNSQGYDNKLGFVIDKSPGNNFAISASGLPTINDGKWHYASVVFDAVNNTNVTGTIYLDGKSYGSQTSTVARSGWASTTSYPMRIGTTGIANSEFFPGFVDEVKIYPYARTAAQIKADYNSRGTVAAAAVVIGTQQSKALSEGLVGYWKMDEASWNGTSGEVVDSSGNSNNGTSTNDATTSVGKFGNGGSFDGVNDTATVTDPASGVLDFSTNSFSYSLWINFDLGGDVLGNWQVPFNKGASNYTPPGYDLEFSETSNRLDANLQDTSGGAGGRQTSSYSYNMRDGNWHLVNVVVDRIQQMQYLYVDSVLRDSDSVAAVGDISTSSNLSLGLGGGAPFDGKLDDVRIYNRALSAAEVRELYDWSPNPVAYWKMDEGTGQSASDISGNGNIGTLGSSGGSDSADPAWTTGKYGNALSFDGSDDYASINYSILYDVTTRGTTYELWLNPKETHTANMSGTDKYRVFMSSYNCTGNKGWNVGYDGTAGSGRLYVAINSTIIVNSTPQTLDIGNWYHIVFVAYAGSTGSKIYLDGNNITNSGTSVSYVATDLSLNIGRQASNSCGGSSYRYTNGSIDDVRIYNYARSAKEIVEDMNAGHPAGGSPVGSQAAYWKFNEGSGPITSSSVWTQAGTTTNLVTNPSFETGTTGWDSAGWGTCLQSSTYKKYGNYSYYCDNGGTQTIPTYYMTSAPIAGLSFSAWVYSTTAKSVNIRVANSSWSILATATFSVPANQWTKLNVYYNNPSVQELRFNLQGLTFYVDAAQVEVATSPTPYCDGSIVGNGTHSWNGTAHASTSTCTYGQDGEINGATWITNGKFDKALSFDGTNDYVNVGNPSNLNINKDITISAWFKAQANVTTYRAIVSKEEVAAANCPYRLMIWMTTGRPVFDFWGGTTGNLTGTIALNDDAWHHVLVTRDDTSKVLKMYIDGKYNNQSTYSGSINQAGVNENTWIGRSPYTSGNYPFLGIIDEVKIYPYALTSDEVLIDYNRGQTTVMGSTGSSATGSADNSDSREYCPPGNVEGNCANGLNPAPVAEWNFEEGAGSTVKDTSGNENNGAITGATYKTGKVGSALSFVGASSNLVNIGDNASVDFTGSFTLSSWIKTSTTGAIQAFVSKWGNSNGAKQYNLSINDDNTILFAVMHSGASFSWMLSNATVTDNNWHHVEAINDDTTNKLYIYIDGKLDNLVTRTSANSLQNTTTPLRLGEQGDGNGAYYTGLLDNVKLYNYTRTQAQIAYDYNRGAPVGWWKLNECQGITANDSSENNNVGTITIGATVPQTSAGTCGSGVSTEAWNNGTNGKFNASLNFDGVDDYVSSSSFANNFNFNGPFAIAFWFKQDELIGDKTMISNWRMANIGGVINHGMFIERTSVANKTLRFVYRNNGVGVFDFYIGNIYQANQWNHVLAVYDPNLPSANAKIYLNGILGDTTATTNTTFSITGRSLLIGTLDGGADSYGRYFNGQIDDVQVYNYALTAEQIKMIYNDSSAVKF